MSPKTGIPQELVSPNKKIVFHFAPSHDSWLNQIEIWFGGLVRKLIRKPIRNLTRRGNFTSVADLENKIIELIQYHDPHQSIPAVGPAPENRRQPTNKQQSRRTHETRS